MDDHDPAGRAWLIEHLEPLGVPYELFACDPALADTAAFCAAYGFDPVDSANTIVVIGKTEPPRYAACVTLAPYRLDVNRAVRDRLGHPQGLVRAGRGDGRPDRDADRRGDRVRVAGRTCRSGSTRG